MQHATWRNSSEDGWFRLAEAITDLRGALDSYEAISQNELALYNDALRRLQIDMRSFPDYNQLLDRFGRASREVLDAHSEDERFTMIVGPGISNIFRLLKLVTAI